MATDLFGGVLVEKESEGGLYLHLMNERTVSRLSLGVMGRFVIAYVGSMKGIYLIDEMMEFFRTIRDESTFILLLTKDTDGLADRLRSIGFGDEDFLIATARPSEVPFYLHAADVGISFRRDCYSQQAASPTKIPEYLAAGVPVIANKVGDWEFIQENGVGYVLDEFTPTEYRKAIDHIYEMFVIPLAVSAHS